MTDFMSKVEILANLTRYVDCKIMIVLNVTKNIHDLNDCGGCMRECSPITVAIEEHNTTFIDDGCNEGG